jgi:hypothetical protein
MPNAAFFASTKLSDRGHAAAGMGLAFDIGGGGIVLRVQRVELLVKPVALLVSPRRSWAQGM